MLSDKIMSGKWILLNPLLLRLCTLVCVCWFYCLYGVLPGILWHKIQLRIYGKCQSVRKKCTNGKQEQTPWTLICYVKYTLIEPTTFYRCCSLSIFSFDISEYIKATKHSSAKNTHSFYSFNERWRSVVAFFLSLLRSHTVPDLLCPHSEHLPLEP